MKIFLVKLKDWGYEYAEGEYDVCVMVGESEEQVRQVILNGFEGCDICNGEDYFLYKNKEVLEIEEIGISNKYTKPTIICSYF